MFRLSRYSGILPANPFVLPIASSIVYRFCPIHQNNLPIFSYLNPVNLITDGLYALYYYDNLNRYTTNMICLFIIGLILLLGSLIIARRKQYDSI